MTALASSRVLARCVAALLVARCGGVVDDRHTSGGATRSGGGSRALTKRRAMPRGSWMSSGPAARRKRSDPGGIRRCRREHSTMNIPAKAAPREAPKLPSIRVDETRWPLILVTFTGVATDDEFTAYLEEHARLVCRREKKVMVIDAMRAGTTQPTQRKQQAEWQRQHEKALAAYSLGTAFAIGSAIVRGALTAILWVQPLPNPHFVAASLADAERWAAARLLDAGLRAPVTG
jgi:hypothetical protein